MSAHEPRASGKEPTEHMRPPHCSALLLAGCLIVATAETGAETTNGTPKSPLRFETTVYDSWIVTCQRSDAESGRRCNATLRAQDAKSKRTLLLWTLARDQQNRLVSVFQTPTGVQIQAGIELKIGDGPVRRLSYSICTQEGCRAGTLADEELIREAASASSAQVTIQTVDGRRPNFVFSIKGFESALAALGK